MTIKIVESARQDLNAGWQFYEAQEAGLGDYFIAALKADIEGLRITAGVHAKAYGNYHRLLSHKFPFAVFYLHDADLITIYAVVDCRREPLWIYNRLKGLLPHG
jgi:hypothetical protein